MVDIARALQGLGAAVGGQVPQFEQRIALEDERARRIAQEEADRTRRLSLEDEDLAEKRKKTMFLDAAAASQYLSSGDLDSVESIFSDRINILSNSPNVNTNHTQRKLQLARAAKGGDQEAANTLQTLLDNEVKVGRAYGFIGADSQAPASFRSLKLQAEAAGLEEGTQEYTDFMRYGGSSGQMGAAKTTTYKNGTVVKIPRIGAPQVYAPDGQLVTDAEQKRQVMDAAIQEGIIYEGDIATAKARGTAQEGRAQDIITDGLAAADSTAVIRRSLELLDRVGTGGFNRVSLAAKKLFGIEGADEGELSSNLGKSVLSQLRQTFGAAFTEREGARLENIEAGFSSNAETNKRLLNNALRVAERAAQRAIRRAEQRGDYETADEIESSLDFDLAEFENAFAEESIPPAGGVGAGAPQPSGGTTFVYDPVSGRLVPEGQ